MDEQSPDKKKLPTCPRCGNRLRLRSDQVGSQVQCPKCNATFTVGRPGGPAAPAAGPVQAGRPKSSGAPRAAVPPAPPASAFPVVSATEVENALDNDAYEPEIPLKNFSVVPVEEMSDIGPLASSESQYDVDWRVADDLQAENPHVRPAGAEPDYLELAKAKGIVRTIYRPDPPKWTFFSGVFTFPWRGVNLSRWIVMSLALSTVFMMAYAAADMLGLFGKLSGQALMGLFLGMVTIALALAALSLTAAYFLSAIQDTADGHDEPQEASVPEWNQWLFMFMNLFCLWAAAAALGYPLSLIESVGPVACLVSSVVLFPILLLSAMEADSFFVPYSRAVLGTTVRYWRGWLMFYLLTTAMIVGYLAAFDAGVRAAPYAALLLSGPAAAALVLVYGRLLGRVAWRASGAPVAEQDESERATGSARSEPKKKRRKRPRIQFDLPDELDAAPSARGEESIPPPRVNFHRRS